MAEDDDENPKTGDAKEDKAARMNSAKAFYRAMYAGAEPDPEEFGIDLGAPKQQAGDSASQAAVLHLQDQLKETEARALEWENLYKRILADFDNYKKRMDRERDEMQAIGMQKGLEAILPGLDDLDMAQTKLNEDSDPKVMLQSFKMIVSRFNRCLEQVGIKQIQVVGEMFDPRLHEPIQEVHTAEVPEGAVAQQLRPGYFFGEKILRPALVNVATAPLDGPGYQPPVAASEAAPEATPEPTPEPAQKSAQEGAPEAVVSTDKKIEVSPEDVIAANPAPDSESLPESDSKPESATKSKPEPKPEPKPESKPASEPGGVETSDVLTPVDGEGQLGQQFATQDIPLEEFKASLEAEAAAAASADNEKSGEMLPEEAVASSEEG
jgi:molecular chaperone GrpE